MRRTARGVSCPGGDPSLGWRVLPGGEQTGNITLPHPSDEGGNNFQKTKFVMINGSYNDNYLTPWIIPQWWRRDFSGGSGADR